MARTNTKEDLDLRKHDYSCEQCGQGIPATTIEKRRNRKTVNAGLCADCLRQPQRQIIYQHPVLGEITCYPYAGDVDELWRPLDASGGLFRPGVRLCGHADCVNLNHIAGKQVHKRYANTLETLLALAEAQQWNRKNTKVTATIKSGASPKVN